MSQQRVSVEELIVQIGGELRANAAEILGRRHVRLKHAFHRFAQSEVGVGENTGAEAGRSV